MTASSILRRPHPYNDTLVSPTASHRQALSQTGHFFAATNPTPGTGVNYVVAGSYSATSALLTLRNGGADGVGPPPAPAPLISLDYIRLICTVAPASATAAEFASFLDNTLRGSGGTVLTGNPTNLNCARTSVADLRYTPTTAAAGANAYQVARGKIRTAIPVVGDEYFFAFGPHDNPGTGGLAGTAGQRIVIPHPPVELGPNANQTFLLHLWFPSNATTAAAFEYEVGWHER